MKNKKRSRKEEIQSKVIASQIEEIQALRAQIADLEDDIETKEKMTDMADDILVHMQEISAMFDEYKKDYKDLMDELFTLRKAMDEAVFNGKYKLAKRILFGIK